MSEPTEVAYWQAVGRRVAEARGRLGWTQAQLGTEAGTTKNRITRLEGGEAVSEGVLAEIAAKLGVSVAWLRYGIVVLEDGDRVRREGFTEGWTLAIAELRRFVDRLESVQLPAPNEARPADSASGGAMMADALAVAELGDKAAATPPAPADAPASPIVTTRHARRRMG